MNTRKRTTNRPSTSKQSSANVQRDIREVFTNIKAKTQKGALLAQSVAETSTEPIFADLSTVSSVSNESSTKKLLLKNAYARDLFFRYTNVKTVLSKKFPEHCSERTRLYYEQRVYKFYVLQPKYRIRTTLEDIRFNTRFNEGLFRMALKMPIISAQDHATYNRNLARFGVKKQCFVDMTLNNCVLEDQAKLIKTLKSKYKFWYDKLDKLPKYLSLMQRQNELDNETFLRDLEHHSSMKDCRWLELPDVVGNLVQEVWLPSEKRQCPIWIQLIFDDDALNKKYRVGSYSKFKSTLPANDPEDWIDCGASNRIHTSNQDSLLPDTMSFEPFIFSTQNQPQTNVQSIENRTVASSITRAPLQPTCTSATVVPSERSSPLIDTIRSNTAPPTPSSSIAPPFQAVYPSPTGSTPAAHRVSVPSYSIKKENLSTNATNDQHEDENVTNPEFITIESSPECNTVASFKIKEENLINDRSETAYEVYPEIITIDSSQEGRLNGSPTAESPINPPSIGPYITIETETKRNRQALFTTTTSRICNSKPYMIFLGFVDVQSIRYTNIPTTWPQCNVFQQNQLTCHLKLGHTGVFSVPIRDQQACQLLGLSAGGNGRKALLAALAHVGKFRFGLKEPAKEYYRLSVTEKVLHLYFATFPPCPQNGGFVMFPKSNSSLPAEGDEVWLECFNYYAHAKRPQRTGGDTKEGNTNHRPDRLAKLLLPGIAEKMKTLREKLKEVNGSIE